MLAERRDALVAALWSRRGAVWTAYAALLTLLVVTSTPRRIGDGAEYVAMADNLRHFDLPSLTHADFARVQGLFQRWGSGFPGALSPQQPLLAGGRYDFGHFWMYSLLTVPFFWLTQLISVNPTYAFALVNFIVLLGALWVCLGSLPWPAVALVFVSPIFFWVDKAHTECFTLGLLALAAGTFKERPWWAMAAAGLCATQNPPIGLLVALIAAFALRDDPARWRDTRFRVGAAVGVGVALLHPVYYELRLHVYTPQKLSGGANFHVPGWAEFRAPITDLNIGFLGTWPPFLLALVVVLVASVRRPRSVLSSGFLIALAASLFFLVSFAQTGNDNSGGTTGIDRYCLWLIPLLLFAVAELARSRALLLIPVAALGAGWAVADFLPDQYERYLIPTALASWTWAHHPGWDNPLPEVFVERTLHAEQFAPAATPGCTKALLIAGQPAPPGCHLPPVPAKCHTRTRPCYANRDGTGYAFVVAPSDPSVDK